MTGVKHVHDPIARAVIESAADAIVAVDQRHRVTVWNPAAERMFGWTAEEMVGRVPPIVPDELKAEHNAVQERLLTRRAGEGDGGQISIATRRFHRDGRLIDVRIDTSLLKDPSGTPLGWVGVYHPVDEDELVQHHMTERARLVRRLNDIVADLNAELDLAVVLDRITDALIELTGADAGGFVRIEGDRLRLVSMAGLPEHMRGRSADLRPSLVGELLRSGKTVKLATGERRLGDLIWSELSGLHTIALGLSYLQNRPYGALYALFSDRKVGHTELELLELLAGHAGVAVGNAVAYAEVVRQRAHERAVIDSSADGIAVLDHDLVPAVESGGARADRHPGGGGDRRPLPFAMPALGEMLTSGWSRDVAGRAGRRDRGDRRAGRGLPRRVRGQGAGGGQGPVPRHDQPRAADPDHRRAGVREHAGSTGGTSWPTPTAAPRCRRSPSGPSRWPASWSTCCSGPAPGADELAVRQRAVRPGAGCWRASVAGFGSLSAGHTLAPEMLR